MIDSSSKPANDYDPLVHSLLHTLPGLFIILVLSIYLLAVVFVEYKGFS
jgi:hypothetical protein